MMDTKANVLQGEHGQFERMLVKHGFQLSECDYSHVNAFGVSLTTANYSFTCIASCTCSYSLTPVILE